jgi:hypothetical protein
MYFLLSNDDATAAAFNMETNIDLNRSASMEIEVAEIFNNVVASTTTTVSVVAAITTASAANCSADDHFELANSLIYRITNYMLLLYPWLFVLIGTITNTMSFLAFSRPQLRKNSTFFYLCFLSIVDMFSLHLFCVNLIFMYAFNVDIQKLSIVLCKAYAFLIYFLPQLSAWICAAVSLDRVLCVLLGAKARYFNNPKFSLKVLIFIFTVLFLLNIHFFYYPDEFAKVEMIDKTVLDINIIYCSLEHNAVYEAQYMIWVYIDLFVNVLIPFSIMIVSSLIIISKAS